MDDYLLRIFCGRLKTNEFPEPFREGGVANDRNPAGVCKCGALNLLMG